MFNQCNHYKTHNPVSADEFKQLWDGLGSAVCTPRLTPHIESKNPPVNNDHSRSLGIGLILTGSDLPFLSDFLGSAHDSQLPTPDSRLAASTPPVFCPFACHHISAFASHGHPLPMSFSGNDLLDVVLPNVQITPDHRGILRPGVAMIAWTCIGRLSTLIPHDGASAFRFTLPPTSVVPGGQENTKVKQIILNFFAPLKMPPIGGTRTGEVRRIGECLVACLNQGSCCRGKVRIRLLFHAWSSLSDLFRAAVLPRRHAVQWIPLDEDLLVKTKRATRATVSNVHALSYTASSQVQPLGDTGCNEG